MISRNSIHKGSDRDKLIPIQLQLGPGVEIIGGVTLSHTPQLCPCIKHSRSFVFLTKIERTAKTVASEVDRSLKSVNLESLVHRVNARVASSINSAMTNLHIP